MSIRTNDEWLASLHSDGQMRENALADLREILMRGLAIALSNILSPSHPLYQSLLEDAAQEALLKILNHLDGFEGRSQFTTWAQKIALREGLMVLKRRYWRDEPLPGMQDEENPHEIRDSQPGPETEAERRDLLQRVSQMVAESLTEKQRLAVQLLAEQGLPVETAASQIGIKPNALYKLMYDARARLKQRLEQEGLTPAQVLSIFEPSNR